MVSKSTLWILRGLSAALLLLVLALAFVRQRYDVEEPYPDLTTDPLIAEEELETVLTSPEPVGNVAVDRDGTVLYTVHPESRAPGPRLWAWRADHGPDSRGEPFLPPQRQEELFRDPLGIVVDRQGRTWTIDHGLHGLGRPRLLAFEASGEIVFDLVFSDEIAPAGSFLQDLQIDADGGTVFLADASFWRQEPGLVVVDVASANARRVLDGHPSVTPQRWRIRNPIREMSFLGGFVGFRVGVDGIAITRDDEWIVYGAMNHDTLYRVPTAFLSDFDRSPEEVAGSVEPIGRKPLNDGLSTDVEGNVLVTDVEHGAVVRIAPDGALETLVRSDRVRWADALSFGPDGWLYLADSAIPHQVLRSRSHIREHAPYSIFRFRPGIPGIPGQ